MNKETLTLSECLRRESLISADLDSIYVQSFPLWRLVRTHFRWMALDLNTKTAVLNISLIKTVRDTVLSFWGIMKILLFGKESPYIFFPHPRLFLVNNQYMDRLSDPLIDYSRLKDDCIILERNQNGVHHTPRYHNEKVVYLDFIDNTTRLLSIVAEPIVRQFYKKQIDGLLEVLEQQFDMSSKRAYKVKFVNVLTRKLLLYHLTKPLLIRLKPKCVFFAPRTAFNYVTVFAKQRGITTVELQHGITVGETMLYSGSYHPDIDPDYFLVFGKSNIGPQFSMPMERIRNIGFPYKNYITALGLTKYPDSTVLVISEPLVSSLMVNAVFKLANAYPQYVFHIRCHPQEKISSDLLQKIESFPNIEVVDNSVESFCALSQYSSILGENSSVMYEAMSLHKKVGRLNFGGLHVEENELIHGGRKINCIEDFESFMNQPYSDENDSEDVYSDFNITALKGIV